MIRAASPTPHTPALAERSTASAASRPAFIGYTRRAGAEDPLALILRPTWVDDEAGFLDSFDSNGGLGGEDLQDEEDLLAHGGDPGVAPRYLMDAAVRAHFRAGRGPCCIVSVGLCRSPPAIGLTGDGGMDAASRYGLRDGLVAVAAQHGPTVLVVPEAVYLSPVDYAALVSELLNQNAQRGQRWAIFDLRDPQV